MSSKSSQSKHNDDDDHHHLSHDIISRRLPSPTVKTKRNRGTMTTTLSSSTIIHHHHHHRFIVVITMTLLSLIINNASIATSFGFIKTTTTTTTSSRIIISQRQKTTLTPTNAAQLSLLSTRHNHIPHRRRRQQPLDMTMAASSMTQLRANVAVSLDNPLLPFLPSPHQTQRRLFFGTTGLLSSLRSLPTTTTLLLSFAALLLLLTIPLSRRLLSSDDGGSSSSSSTLDTLLPPNLHQTLTHTLKRLRGKLSILSTTLTQKLLTPLLSHLPSSLLLPLSTTTTTPSIPMPFDKEGGWGTATLLKKTRVHPTNFVRYEFALPREDYVVPLSLGQMVTLCCFSDEEERVVKGDFFVEKKKRRKEKKGETTTTRGVVSVVVPRMGEVEFGLGRERAEFINVLENELDIGGEIAIRPGNQTLFYHGPYLPVTDMIYITYGVGIVPILQQIQSILPSTSSSVKQISVLWINETEDDFDLCFGDLEKEFFKYNKKLEVSCILEDVRGQEGWSMDGKEEVGEAVPGFRSGSMAVVSGPPRFVKKVEEYLIKRQYPEDCICLLP